MPGDEKKKKRGRDEAPASETKGKRARLTKEEKQRFRKIKKAKRRKVRLKALRDSTPKSERGKLKKGSTVAPESASSHGGDKRVRDHEARKQKKLDKKKREEGGGSKGKGGSGDSDGSDSQESESSADSGTDAPGRRRSGSGSSDSGSAPSSSSSSSSSLPKESKKQKMNAEKRVGKEKKNGKGIEDGKTKKKSGKGGRKRGSRSSSLSSSSSSLLPSGFADSSSSSSSIPVRNNRRGRARGSDADSESSSSAALASGNTESSSAASSGEIIRRAKKARAKEVKGKGAAAREDAKVAEAIAFAAAAAAAAGTTTAAAATSRRSHLPPTDPAELRRARLRTVSVALPGSIVSNAQSAELRTYLAGQVARALAIFQVDEIVIYSDTATSAVDTRERFRGANHGSPDLFLSRVLSYVETPQYLRRALFPVHRDLQYAGLLNPLDTPHHMRIDEAAQYREALSLDRPASKAKGRSGSWSNAGMRRDCLIRDRRIKPGMRVTVRIDDPEGSARTDGQDGNGGYHGHGNGYDDAAGGGGYARGRDRGGGQSQQPYQRPPITGTAVAPSEPVADGLYWGYTTRVAGSLSDVINVSPYDGGYDAVVGVCEEGQSVCDPEFELGEPEHLLIVFGGLAGLREAVAADESLPTSDPAQVFKSLVNTCPEQGSRQLRTEESILISLAALQPHIRRHRRPANVLY